MNRTQKYRKAVFIAGVGLFGAIAVVLIPGLFAEFRTGRLIAVLVLLAGIVVFAVAANLPRWPGNAVDP